MSKFDSDPFPGRPKVLFIGFAESSHTHSWIDLLEGQKFNFRLFSLPSAVPPKSWPVKTYVTITPSEALDPENRLQVYPPVIFRSRIGKGLQTIASHGFKRGLTPTIEGALAQAIRTWRPDVIHTLGFESASYFYLRARDEYDLQGIGKWVAQARGGPDLMLNQFVPETMTKIRRVLEECDHFIADNIQNYEFALKQGLSENKIDSPGVGVVSGPGGIDVEQLRGKAGILPSKRPRVIVWPKTYETISSKALPVFEAINLAWDKIKPCRIEMLWLVQPDVRIWFQKMLPTEIQESCRIHGRLEREPVLDMLTNARVMLAPSLTDGVPNSMMEAMACGAFPIVSPVETVANLVEDQKHVLFARNLYPGEIAAALVRAMSDDRLVDEAFNFNFNWVKDFADRSVVRRKVIAFYEAIGGSPVS